MSNRRCLLPDRPRTFLFNCIFRLLHENAFTCNMDLQVGTLRSAGVLAVQFYLFHIRSSTESSPSYSPLSIATRVRWEDIRISPWNPEYLKGDPWRTLLSTIRAEPAQHFAASSSLVFRPEGAGVQAACMIACTHGVHWSLYSGT